MCCWVYFSSLTWYFTDFAFASFDLPRYATSIDCTENGDTAVIEGFLEAAVKGQCKRLKVKTLDDNVSYQPNRRPLNCLNLKKDYLGWLGDLSTWFPWELVRSFD